MYNLYIYIPIYFHLILYSPHLAYHTHSPPYSHTHCMHQHHSNTYPPPSQKKNHN
ncbi:hypothetical protein P280DRAFT_469550, partial [Massarina eburnea CBS 473.64]